MEKVKEKINENLVEGYPVSIFNNGMMIFRVIYSNPQDTRFLKNPYKIIGPDNIEYIIARSPKNKNLMLAIDMGSKERALPDFLFRDNGNIFNPSEFEVIDKKA